jgi:L-galactonate 5-dehydrogenase
MRAVTIEQPGRVVMTDIDRPEPSSGEVLIRVLALGLCGSDLSSFRGQNPMVVYPVIPGHEIAGEIADGSGSVAGLHRGQLVTLLPYTTCGTCPSCRRGSINACRDNRTMGVRRAGAATDYVTAPARDIIVAEGLSVDQAACVEPLAVGFHAVERGFVQQGDAVLVLGCGVVGLGAVAAAASRGAKVIAADLDKSKLARAVELGAAYTVTPSDPAWSGQVLELTGGDGPDLCIEAAGSPPATTACVELCAFSGRIVLVGYAKNPTSIETRLAVAKELTVRGSRNALADDFRRVIRLLSSGAITVDRLVTQRCRMNEIPDALSFWDSHQADVVKILAGC